MNAFALLLAAGLTQLQMPGTFHAGESIATDGETWLALRREPDGGAALIAATLQVRAAFDAILDQEGEQTASAIASPALERSDAVIAYLRGPTLQPGAVQSVAAPDLLAVDRVFALDDAATLGYRCTASTGGATQCALQYRRGDRMQVLAEFDAWRDDSGALMLGDDAQPRVLFAGDLDRDGAPDLVLDITAHYNVSHVVLWLSGMASGHELLHAAASMRTTGC